MFRRIRPIVFAGFTLAALCGARFTLAAPKVGDVVEVKVSGSWSAATVKQLNGQQVLVQYDDGSQEWVTPDRILHAGGSSSDSSSSTPADGGATASSSTSSGAASGAPTSGAPSAAAPASSATSAGLTPGAVIQVREGNTWSPVTIVSVKGNQALVQYADGSREWVGPDRIKPLPPPLTVGATIQVREGDSWSTVTIVSVKANQALVQYSDGTREWIGPDRMQQAPSAASASPPAPASDSGAASPADIDTPGASSPEASAPAPSAVRAFSQGEAVEVKRDHQWRPGHIQQISGRWYLISEDADTSEVRWFEPWYLRVVGSDYEVASDGVDWTRGKVQPGQFPPSDPPKDMPATTGDPYTIFTGHHLVDDLNNSAVPITFDNSHDPAPGSPLVKITPLPAYNEFAAWAVRGADNGLDKMLPCLGSVRVAVATFPGGFGRWTEVIRVNLLGHGQLDKRTINVSGLNIVSAAEDGDLLLSLAGPSNKHLQLWQWDGKAYQVKANLQLGQNDQGQGIASAQFVSPTKAVVVDGDDNVMLLDLATHAVICAAKKAKETPVYVQPSGAIVGIVTTNNSAMLLHGEDFSTIVEFKDAAAQGNVTVDPTGQYAAYLSVNGNVRVAKIADNVTLGSISVGSGFDGQIDLVDAQFLLTFPSRTQRQSWRSGDLPCTAYQIKTGMPIWIYNLPNNLQYATLPNGQYLMGAENNGVVAVAEASIPDHTGRGAMANATANDFILRPGMPVKIDADYGPFGDDRDKAQAAVNKAVDDAGLKRTDQDSDFHLSVSVTGGPSHQEDYGVRDPRVRIGGPPIPMPFPVGPPPDSPFAPRLLQTVNVPSNILNVTLNYKGKPVWTQQVVFQAGGNVQYPENQSLQDAVNAAARPMAASLDAIELPSYLPVGATPGTPPALGQSDIQSQRFVPRKLTAATPAPW